MFKLIVIVMITIFSSMISAKEPTLSIGENYVLKSKVLTEDRPYSVYLPDKCEQGGASTPCPVLYLLDGNYHFQYASALLERMSSVGQIPDMILVAISNTDRTRDLTPTHSSKWIDGEILSSLSSSGGGDAFLDFIEAELIPEIEARYHPMPYKILVGHSFGGLATLHSFIVKPDLFQAHIAIDPSLWWDDQDTLLHAETYLAKEKSINNKVFITIAEHGPKGVKNNTIMETSSERFTYALEMSGSKHLKFGLKQFIGEDHGSVTTPSLYYGLKFVFDGYKNPPPAITNNGIDAIELYYHNYLGRNGIHLLPPQAVIFKLIASAKKSEEYEKSLEYSKYNISIYPDSADAHFSLASSYQKVNNKNLAVKHYNRALALEPKYEAAVKSALKIVLTTE